MKVAKAPKLFMLLSCLAILAIGLSDIAEAGRRDQVFKSAPRDWSIVATYEIPEGASGLAWDGTSLYCGIYGSNGGNVYQIDPSDGSYTLAFAGPHEDAYGLTFDGTYLWTMEHPSNPSVAMQLNGSGGLVSQFNLPDQYMSGIAHDAGTFWVSTYYPDPSTIYHLDATGGILKQFTAPDNQPWDLCMGDGDLWMADYWGDALYRIDTATGALLESFPSEGIDPAGIVFDGQYLWYCDNGADYTNDYLYKIDLSGAGTPVINLPLDTYDFGVVTVGDAPTWSAVIENTGTADLTISAITFAGSSELSCPSDLPIVISPAGQTTVDLIFTPLASGSLDAVATIASSDPVNLTVDIALTGEAVNPGPDIHLPSLTHDYGTMRNNASKRWDMVIVNLGDENLTISDILSDDFNFTLDYKVTFPITLNVLDTIEIGIWFQPDVDMPYSAKVDIYSDDPDEGVVLVTLSGNGLEQDWPMGESLWSHTITGNWDNTPKAMMAIPDVSGDGVPDIIVCSEDDFVRCFNGNSHGVPDVLWEHEIIGGSVYSQKGIAVMDDIDEDGFSDVVIGAAWGGQLIRAISGKTGNEIWTHETEEYGGGGWVYQVTCQYDYNDDGSVDVLAAAGNNGESNTGPKRVYCLNGLSGVPIWECPLGGAVFAVIGVEDFTGDGQPDVAAGASSADEASGKAFGIDGATGAIKWEYQVPGSAVWAMAPTGDIDGDGSPDVIVGDFSGNVFGVETKEGTAVFSNGGFGTLVGFASLDDVNGDGFPDIVPAHFGSSAKAVDGRTGATIWSQPVADNPAVTARIGDVNGDGINDVLVGTLFNSNYCYFLDGVDGEILYSYNFSTPVDAIAAIPDVVGDGSMEMVVGGRDGSLTCFSGGLEALMFICADINDDGSDPDISDLVYLVDYMFLGGPPPQVPEAANINGMDELDIADLVYLVDWMFNGGPPPIC